ncbi:hypothetical protein IV203_037506 [Nitzschia inconspicua]|uniref:Uncharacterized protein n=1 Tax=Nitzschia inconspicua TaxID=303405 RepID=A0A9K3Q122_9STRA|nr:hypothetical protein IV203_037506 [Nitzschia inconspicua]
MIPLFCSDKQQNSEFWTTKRRNFELLLYTGQRDGRIKRASSLLITFMLHRYCLKKPKDFCTMCAIYTHVVNSEPWESPYFYTGARTHPIRTKNDQAYDPTFFYMGGGAGYVLTVIRNTVRAIIQEVFQKFHAETVGSAEDV